MQRLGLKRKRMSIWRDGERVNLKHYKKAPLPFIGQKRNFIKHFIPLLQRHIPNDGAGWTIVDVFGGSGLLAHAAKRTLPQARVIYNDFDGYTERLRHIGDTEQLRQKCAAIIGERNNRRIEQETKLRLVAEIEAFDGFIDVQTLAGWFLFSGDQVGNWQELKNKKWWNTLPKSPYADAGDYLDGLEIRQQCFTTLLPEFAGQPETLLLLDPPYISTKQGAYAKEHYFSMVDFLKLAEQIKPPFMLFGSTRSEVLDYAAWTVKEKRTGWQHWDGYQVHSLETGLNHAAKYQDNMVWRF